MVIDTYRTFVGKCDFCREKTEVTYDENGNMICEDCFMEKIIYGEYEHE